MTNKERKKGIEKFGEALEKNPELYKTVQAELNLKDKAPLNIITAGLNEGKPIEEIQADLQRRAGV